MAELSQQVQAPTIDFAILRERHRMASSTSDLDKLYAHINFLRKENLSLIGKSYPKLARLSCSMHVKTHAILLLMYAATVLRKAISI